VLVHERHSTRNPGEITGYAVASADSLDAQGKPIYYGGGRLAADLTLPKLRARWQSRRRGRLPAPAPRTQPPPRPPAGRTRPAPAERETGPRSRRRNGPVSGEQATAAAARATEQISSSAEADPRAAGDGLGGLGLPGRRRPAAAVVSGPPRRPSTTRL
jgi:hypothetical protein